MTSQDIKELIGLGFVIATFVMIGCTFLRVGGEIIDLFRDKRS